MQGKSHTRWGRKVLLVGVVVLGVVRVAPDAGGGSAAAGKEEVRWGVLDPAVHENLSLFPITTSKPGDTTGFLTLEEGLASGEVVVRERGVEILRRSRGPMAPRVPDGGARANELVLLNHSDKPLVLLAGEVVTGGKQDRVIAKDRVVSPGAEPLPLDVFCVERGRWAGPSAGFSAAKLFVHPSVREQAAVERKQEEVWAAVRRGTTHRAAGAAGAPAAPPQLSAERIEDVIASEARSESYVKVYQSSRLGASVEEVVREVERRFARALRNAAGRPVVGVVVAYGDEVAWADIFASESLFERYWPKLLRSYVVEALARPSEIRESERATRADVRAFLEPLRGHETVESEPGVYRWRQVAQGRQTEITLEALGPKPMTLHWLRIQRTR